jgi:hypothetical protein
MCIDIFCPGSCLDIDVLLEQIWIEPRKDASGELYITEVYDLLISNPQGQESVNELWALYPNDCTEKKTDGTRQINLKVWPVTPSSPPEMKRYEWAFPRTDWADSTKTSVARMCLATPSDPLEDYTNKLTGKVLNADCTFPGFLNPQLQNILSDDKVRKTLILLKLKTPLDSNTKGWLRFIVRPSKLDQTQIKPVSLLGSFFPLFFKRRLTVACPGLIQDSLQASLSLKSQDGHQEHQQCQEIRQQFVENGFYKRGTTTRVENQWIAVIGLDGVDVGNECCSFPGRYCGVIPRLENPTWTGLWWECGSVKDPDHDIVEIVKRIISQMEYHNGQGDKLQLAWGLAPSGTHEAFCSLIDNMAHIGLLSKVSDTQFRLPDDHPRLMVERMVKLRQLYALPWNSLENLRRFGDLQSLKFRIDYTATWCGVESPNAK